MSGSSLAPGGGLVSYLRFLCLFAHSGVQQILCCVFVLFSPSCVYLSLDCPFWIAPSAFSNVYLQWKKTPPRQLKLYNDPIKIYKQIWYTGLFFFFSFFGKLDNLKKFVSVRRVCYSKYEVKFGATCNF